MWIMHTHTHTPLLLRSPFEDGTTDIPCVSSNGVSLKHLRCAILKCHSQSGTRFQIVVKQWEVYFVRQINGLAVAFTLRNERRENEARMRLRDWEDEKDNCVSLGWNGNNCEGQANRQRKIRTEDSDKLSLILPQMHNCIAIGANANSREMVLLLDSLHNWV